jgi:tripartite-type tricarboxylate transporter receptor subunit TctC
VAHALETPALQKLDTVSTMERHDMTLEQFAQFIREDTANWTRQIKAADIKPARTGANKATNGAA